jgi:hypothetical protein
MQATEAIAALYLGLTAQWRMLLHVEWGLLKQLGKSIKIILKDFPFLTHLTTRGSTGIVATYTFLLEFALYFTYNLEFVEQKQIIHSVQYSNKRRLNSRNAYYHPVQNILSFNIPF